MYDVHHGKSQSKYDIEYKIIGTEPNPKYCIGENIKMSDIETIEVVHCTLATKLYRVLFSLISYIQRIQKDPKFTYFDESVLEMHSNNNVKIDIIISLDIHEAFSILEQVYTLVAFFNI